MSFYLDGVCAFAFRSFGVAVNSRFLVYDCVIGGRVFVGVQLLLRDFNVVGFYVVLVVVAWGLGLVSTLVSGALCGWFMSGFWSVGWVAFCCDSLREGDC